MRSLRYFSVSLAGFAAASLFWSGFALTNAALGLAPPAFAQGTTGSPDRSAGRKHFAEMLASLRPPLSDAQKAQIRQLREQMRSENKNQPATADPEQRRARFTAFLERIRGVLTPAQRADFDAKRQAMRAGQPPH
jgi:Spy/CpxP family protein refolding chaperone